MNNDQCTFTVRMTSVLDRHNTRHNVHLPRISCPLVSHFEYALHAKVGQQTDAAPGESVL